MTRGAESMLWLQFVPRGVEHAITGHFRRGDFVAFCGATAPSGIAIIGASRCMRCVDALRRARALDDGKDPTP